MNEEKKEHSAKKTTFSTYLKKSSVHFRTIIFHQTFSSWIYPPLWLIWINCAISRIRSWGGRRSPFFVFLMICLPAFWSSSMTSGGDKRETFLVSCTPLKQWVLSPCPQPNKRQSHRAHSDSVLVSFFDCSVFCFLIPNITKYCLIYCLKYCYSYCLKYYLNEKLRWAPFSKWNTDRNFRHAFGSFNLVPTQGVKLIWSWGGRNSKPSYPTPEKWQHFKNIFLEWAQPMTRQIWVKFFWCLLVQDWDRSEPTS